MGKSRSKRSVVEPGDLPDSCFVSHSYDDDAALKKLRKLLPKSVNAVTFPRQEPDPSKPVSSEIIPTILDCTGLIYLEGGSSCKSFWVSFERDYALRSGRKVFAFDPGSGTLRRDTSSPIPLRAAMAYHDADERRVRELLSWMVAERHFEIEDAGLHSTFGGFTGDIMIVMEELLLNGGLILWFMGAGITAIADSFYSDQFVEYLLDYSESEEIEYDWIERLREMHKEDGNDDWTYEEDDEYYNEEENRQYTKEMFLYDYYNNVAQVVARIDPELPADWRLLPWASAEVIAEGGNPDLSDYRMIDLYEGTSDDSFNWNRIDDLIIEIYRKLLPPRTNAEP